MPIESHHCVSDYYIFVIIFWQKLKMSSNKKNAQMSVFDFLARKRRADEIDDDDESILSSTSKQSKPNPNVQYALKMHRIACMNGKEKLLFSFDFHLSGTDDDQSNIGYCGERELSDEEDSTLKINIEGTAHDNVEISVKLDSKCFDFINQKC